ncbi:phosphohydrolase [Lachnospiraceae bacterium]|nr:phosphohydrolase [Lachnospiraceae bacterium]
MRENRRKKKLIRIRNTRQAFYECIDDLVKHPLVVQMKKYPQHGNTNCYRHCLHVAYYNYRICARMGLRAREAARAGMLHDMFLYDWHTYARETGSRFHGLKHPGRVLKVVQGSFSLSELEKDMILKHMWPLTPVPPRYAESYIICLVDKYCSTCETIERFWKKSR